MYVLYIIFEKCVVNDESTINGNGDLKNGPVCICNILQKKSVSWKQDSDLVEVTYFEYDESERSTYFILIIIYFNLRHTIILHLLTLHIISFLFKIIFHSYCLDI